MRESPFDPDVDQHLRRQAKRALRAKMRATRARVPAEQRAERSERIRAGLLSLPSVTALRADDLVVSFMPIRAEPDLRPLHATLRAMGAHLVLPRVEPESGDLILHRVDADAEAALQPGAFGVSEPSPELPVVSGGDVRVIFIPGLVMDVRGHRLGYGRGFFDRLLPNLEGATKVGVCYDFQLVGELPDEPHDVPLDYVVTDARRIDAGAGADG